jgi:hypothetical protein
MKTRRSALASLLASAYLVACGGSDDPADSIEITSASPTSGRAGTDTTFTITFRYTLTSKPHGVIDLGFFVDGTNQRLSGSRLSVVRGSGQGSLTSPANPQNYTTGPDFAVGLLLSEEPHADSWTPLSRARYAIGVVQ